MLPTGADCWCQSNRRQKCDERGRGGCEHTHRASAANRQEGERVPCLESQLGGVCARIFGEGLLQGAHKMPLRASHLGPPSHRAHSGRVPRVRRRHNIRNYGIAQKNEKAGRGDTVRTARPGPPQSAYDAGPMRGSWAPGASSPMTAGIIPVALSVIGVPAWGDFWLSD